MRRVPRWRRSWAIVVAAAVVLAGCGVQNQSDAEVLSEDVPFDLLEPAPTTTTTSPEGLEVELYFTDSEGLLRPVPRRVSSSPSLTELVTELDEPPVEAGDLRTALGEELVLSVDLEGGIALVDLGEDFTDLPLSDQVLALAQIVYTLTARPGVGRVGFQLEGSPVPIPRGDGVITTDTVSRDAYANLLAPLV